jgi:hypothetical protein
MYCGSQEQENIGFGSRAHLIRIRVEALREPFVSIEGGVRVESIDVTGFAPGTAVGQRLDPDKNVRESRSWRGQPRGLGRVSGRMRVAFARVS